MKTFNKSTVNTLDLFAGAGGISLGFHMAGYAPGVMIDHCPYTLETLKTNLGHLGGVVLNQDLQTLTPQQLTKYLDSSKINSKFDLIIGGPPCQGWSMAGRAKLKSLGRSPSKHFKDSRNKLLMKYVSFVKYFQPKAFLMENVPGIRSYYGVNVLEKVMSSFEKAGFNTTCAEVNAHDFGIPQKRKRIIVVGVRKDLDKEFSFPQTNGLHGARKFPMVTLRDAILDLPIIRDGNKVLIKPYNVNQNDLSPYARLMRKGADQQYVFDHICTEHRDSDVEAFRLLGQGGTYRDLPSKYKRYRDDTFSDKYQRLSWNEPSRCITAHLSKDCYSHIHPTQARTITVREAARIQSFPDGYFFNGGMCSQFKQIGNAVPPLLIKAFALEIGKQILGSEKLTNQGRLDLLAW